MNAVMARILGLAGSGGAFRWASAGEVKSRTAERRSKKRTVPRRIVDLQLGRSCAPTRAAMLHEGGDAGDALADYELVDVVGAFIGEDAFEVVHVAHDRVIVDDAVGAKNVAGLSRGFERDGHVVHFEHGDVRGV